MKVSNTPDVIFKDGMKQRYTCCIFIFANINIVIYLSKCFHFIRYMRRYASLSKRSLQKYMHIYREIIKF